MTTAVLALLAYFVGSLPFAVIVSRGFGLADPRTYGSKNPGATNVLRSGNKLAAALTLLGDAAKGWLDAVALRPSAPGPTVFIRIASPTIPTSWRQYLPALA